MAEPVCVHSQRINDFIDENFGDIYAPFSAGFELTAKCNLNCIHCYAQCDRNHRDFTTDEFKHVFDQLIERGMLETYFTGGEIFVRPDFDELYKYAKSKGVIMVLLSNITLLNKHHIELFKEYPVELVSTTMYGYSQETYERVTGVKGSYNKFMNALELLQKNDIRYELKFVTMKQNMEDLYKVREFGKKLGVEMIISIGIHPESDGTLDPMDCRLTPEEAVQFDYADPDRRNFWKDVGRQLLSGEIPLIPDRAKRRFNEGLLYPCSIANQHVFITSDLQMQGCVRASYRKYDLRSGSFDDGWAYLQRELVQKKSSPAFKCRNCQDIRFCEQCTANFGQAFGDEEHIDEFYCKVAALRRELVEKEAGKLIVEQI
ncbi:MAG: radical SAM protein [Lachnospiraceae bacterium]|nr:radical SAM protein [Lachnospiraceae bacterium]